MLTFSQIVLLVIAGVTLVTAAVALSLKNIIRGALLLTASWFGIAAFYLWAGAEFAAFAQALVYVGAISMVVLFAVLLTRPRTVDEHGTAADAADVASGGVALSGKIAAGIVALVLAAAVLTTPLEEKPDAAAPVLPVAQIGKSLMLEHAGALLIIGVLLTVALLGAVVIAAPVVDAAGGTKKH